MVVENCDNCETENPKNGLVAIEICKFNTTDNSDCTMVDGNFDNCETGNPKYAMTSNEIWKFNTTVTSYCTMFVVKILII